MGKISDVAAKVVMLDGAGNIVNFRDAVSAVSRKEEVSEEVAAIAVAYAAVRKRGGGARERSHSVRHRRQAHQGRRGGAEGVS